MIWLCAHVTSGGLRPDTFFTARGKQPDYPMWNNDKAYWNPRFHGTGNYVLAKYKTERDAYAHVKDWAALDKAGVLQWTRPTVAYERAWL